MNFFKPLKMIFSVFTRFFKSIVVKTQTPEPEVSEPTPPVTVERPSIDITKPQKEIPIPPVKNKASTPPVIKKRAKKTSKGKFDKKGFRIITDNDSFSQLFQVDKKRESEENFAQLFENSQTDTYQQQMLKEKKDISARTKPSALTVNERIKSFPVPQEELDLHGYTAMEAESRAETFIRNARLRRLRTVRVIVGKGLHSNGKAVLPNVVETKIIQLKQNRLVLSYKWEKKDKRKSGALIVYLT
jgi:DNA-nicking Smr family endonuclease